MREGVTLIELVVVVLIIGILASVGVAQYEKAVIKGRLAGKIAVVKSIGDAREIHFFSNGDYADCEGLDIEIPQNISCIDGSTALTKGQVYAHSTDGLSKVPTILSERMTISGISARYLFCLGNKDGDKISNEICKSFGGRELTNMDPALYGARYYVLN